VSNPAPQAETKFEPAVPVRKSISPEAVTSLIDGKPYKSLKRHLNKHGLTPEQYRTRYNLSVDYPMVAPNYAAKRSELARAAGLGQQRRKGTAKKAATSETVADKAPKKGGRKKGA
jgi:predicted transcriptional regulator